MYAHNNEEGIIDQLNDGPLNSLKVLQTEHELHYLLINRKKVIHLNLTEKAFIKELLVTYPLLPCFNIKSFQIIAIFVPSNIKLSIRMNYDGNFWKHSSTKRMTIWQGQNITYKSSKSTKATYNNRSASIKISRIE